jgi:AcrR family transcriptional regulator
MDYLAHGKLAGEVKSTAGYMEMGALAGKNGQGGQERRGRDADATRRALLGVAILRFRQDGFERTRLRDIAADVGVNAALINRYFGSKKQLFTEAMAAHADRVDRLTDRPLDALAQELVALACGADDAEDNMLLLIRSAGHADARERLQADIADIFTTALAARLGGEQAGLRAELLAAWAVGIGFLREIVHTPALSQAGVDDIEHYVSAAADALIIGCRDRRTDEKAAEAGANSAAQRPTV